jgi:hypothetical protein
MPCSQRGTGQGGCLDIGEIFRHRDERLGIYHEQLSKHTVDCRTSARACELARRQRTIDPLRKKSEHDALPDLDPANSGSDGFDSRDCIRCQDSPRWRAPPIETSCNEQVAVIQGNRSNADQNLPGARPARFRTLREPQSIAAVRFVYFNNSHTGWSRTILTSSNRA